MGWHDQQSVWAVCTVVECLCMSIGYQLVILLTICMVIEHIGTEHSCLRAHITNTSEPF